MPDRIGIDLGGTKIEGLLLDQSGQVVRRQRIPTGQADGYMAIVERIAGLIKTLTHQTDGDYSVGICTPGAISKTSGRIKNSNTTCLIGQPLKEDIEALIGRPVLLENDANCFAVAEATRGAAHGYNLVFGVIMGTGVGGGIVLDGRILAGASNIAGEWGHHKIDRQGPLCYCGQRGCVESFISGPALERRWRQLTGDRQPLSEISKLTGTTAAGSAADHWKIEFLETFGLALANVINILDPDAIVLGGGVSNIPYLYDAGLPAVYRYVFSDTPATPILKNALGDSAGVFGAALLEV
ncbi:MAG: ROK family protein [Candidatus Neomarinimicrobiota bacterium]